MIGQLTGLLVTKQPPLLLLDVNGVGYEVEAPMSTFYNLPDKGEKTSILIHTHVREDALQLYGFATSAERNLFRALIKVSGVGAKLALTILSGISVEAFSEYVESEDSTSLTRLPGVGKKTAQRLVIEMKDKLKTVVSDINEQFGSTSTASISISKPIEEAVSALIALGYKPPEASRMIRAVKNEADAETTEDFIRLALQTSVNS